MKGFVDELGVDRPACVNCKHRGKMTVEVPCYNCISPIDLASCKPNYQTEFAAFEPKFEGGYRDVEEEAREIFKKIKEATNGFVD